MSAMNPRDWLSALRAAWTRFSLADRIALGIVVLRAALWLLVESRLISGVPGFLSFLFFLAVAFLLLRFLGWWRSRLLWSLRNRLVVAYLFIAVVPVLLLLTMVVISAEILYSQLGAYLLWDELHQRVEMLSDAGEHLVAGEATLSRGISPAAADAARRAQAFAAHDRDLPGLTIDFHGDPELFRKLGQSEANSFAAIVQVGNTLELLALRRHESPAGGSNVVLFTLPV